MPQCPEDAWQRAVKVQEVILRAVARQVTGWQAAEILRISARSMLVSVLSFRLLASNS